MAQRPSVANELWRAAQEALGGDASTMSSDVRTKATEMVWPSPLNIPIKLELISCFTLSHTSTGMGLEMLVSAEICSRICEC